VSDEISGDPRPVAYWLLAICSLVFAMVVLGGVTRLTGSGLSMVNWEPLMGILPPLGTEAWQHSFEQYQQFPEYKKINIGMDLAGYQSIFWLEYIHRLLGRSIGLAFFLPFLYFYFKGRFARPIIPKLITMFALGAAQGLMGWYMVKSGLVNNPHVSQYRLTAHLLLAFAIYAYMFWVAVGLLFEHRTSTEVARQHKIQGYSWALLLLITITVISGGFVAGLKAGHVSASFPLMFGALVPDQIYTQANLVANMFEDPVTVMFNHRLLAVLTFLLICLFCYTGIKNTPPGPVRKGISILLLVAVVQVTLGISTIVMHVPITLAATHQAVALILFSSGLFVCSALKHTA